MKSTENTNKDNRTLKYSNGLNYRFHDLYSYMGILVDMSGYSAEDFAQRVGLIGRVVNVLDWDINGVFNDSTTQGLTGTVT